MANYDFTYTGAEIQAILDTAKKLKDSGYIFLGVATPSTNPGTPTQKVYYEAKQAGTYTNFGGVVLPDGISLLIWNGSWTSETVMCGDGGVFDISVYKSSGGTLATYADLAAALDGGNNIPASARKGGMSVKFVQSSDNKYIQARCIADSFSTYIEDWVEVGSEITKEVDRHFRNSTNVCSGVVEYAGKSINASGEVIDNSAYNVSNMFPIKGATIYTPNQISFLAYYDVNGEFIGRPNIESSTITTPSYARYARISSNRHPSLWQLNEGDTLLTYETPDSLISQNVTIPTDNTFTQKGIAADAYTLGATRTIIPLKVMAGGGIVSQLNVGEYGFNFSQSINKVIYKVGPGSAENFDYIYILPNINCRYLYNGDIYKWNGEALVKDEDVQLMQDVNELKNEVYITDLSSSGIHAHSIKAEKTYRFINTCDVAIAINLKVTQSGENITVSSNLLPSKYVDYIPSVDTNYVVIGGIDAPLSARIIDLETISGKVYLLQQGKGTVVIKASAASGADIISLLEIDEYGLIIASNVYKLVRKNKSNSYEDVAFSENTIYIWNESVYKWNGEKLVDVLQPLHEEVESMGLNLYGRTLTTSNEVITLQQGKTYVFTNNGNADVVLNARVTLSGSNVPISSLLHSGESVTYVASQTTYYIFVGSSEDKKVFVEEKIGNALNMGVLGVLTDNPNYVNFIKGHTYKFINKDADCNLILLNGSTEVWRHTLMRPFEEDIVTLPSNVDVVLIGTAGGRNIEVYDLGSLGGIFSVHDQGMSFDVPVEFDLTEEIEDVSQDFNTFDFSDTIYQEDMLEQIYAHMDKLCALYPSYVKKYDPMASSDVNQTVTIDGTDYTVVIRGMSDVKSAMTAKGFSDYPEYANGINSPVTRTLPKGDGTTYEVTYDITPAYKTYLYTFISEDSNLVGDYVKRKVFITGGVHANERMSPVNLCILAKKLCESADENAYKLRALCDYYIIPYVNGYGCYHTRRPNANWVDLNKNYQTKNWTFLTNGLDDRDIWKCIYSGPEAGSEFETNLVESIFNYIKPDFGIDHHNYSNSQQQFYVEYGGNYRPVLMRAATDTFKALQKKYSSDFGNDYKLFIGSESIRLARNATTDMFMRENTENNAAITIEVSQCVNYVNGVYTSRPTETFNGKVANIAYYTLKHLLMVLVENFYKKYGMIKHV